jgi:hypothetical protein
MPAWTTPFTNPMTTAQDLMVGGAGGAPARLAVGTNTQVLTVTAGVVGWAAAPAGLTNPMTNIGDLIRGGTSGVPTRLAAVATGAVLASAGLNTAPVWSVSPALTDLKLGGGAIGTSGVGVLALGPSTTPTTSPVDTVQLYTADIGGEAGSRGLVIRDERGGTTEIGTVTTSGNWLTNKYGTVISGIVSLATLAQIGTFSGHQVDLVVGGGVHIKIQTDSSIHMYQLGLGMRQIGYGGVDSGGAGYRQMRIPN